MVWINTKGQVIIDGKDISNYNKRQLTEYRRNDVGFIFQFYNLVQNLTSKENIELASEIVEDALNPEKVLEDVGLKKRMNNFPAELSGGDQQRVAIARAIAKNPKILLCDEPTGALDYQTGKQVLKILQNMSRERNATVVIVTHNSAIAPIADRVIHIRNAQVSDIKTNPNPKDIIGLEWYVISLDALKQSIKKSYRNSIGRFLSIFLLMALGSFALVVLKINGRNMRSTSRDYYDKANLADITVIGSMGIDDKNVDEIDKTSGVNQKEYGYLKDVTLEGTTDSLIVFSKPK